MDTVEMAMVTKNFSIPTSDPRNVVKFRPTAEQVKVLSAEVDERVAMFLKKHNIALVVTEVQIPVVHVYNMKEVTGYVTVKI